MSQDPDVILIGEMRDYETISLALTAAEMGHLVFGTLHTSSAAQAIERIIDACPTNAQDQARTREVKQRGGHFKVLKLWYFCVEKTYRTRQLPAVSKHVHTLTGSVLKLKAEVYVIALCKLLFLLCVKY